MLVLLLGCRPDDASFEDVEATRSTAIPTVVTVGFGTSLEGEAFVEYGPDEAYGTRVPARPDGERHVAVLRGLAPGETFHFRVGVDETVGRDGTFTAGHAPPSLPSFTETAAEAGAFDGFFALALPPEPSEAVVVDASGRPVWWHVLEEEGALTTRVIPTLDGEGVLLNGFLWEQTEHGRLATWSVLRRVAWDGTVLEEIEVEGAHHDFTELPDGTIACIVGTAGEVDGQAVRAEAIVEVRPDGEQVTVWSAWDEADRWLEASDGRALLDLNAIEYDPETDGYVVGARDQGSLLAIDRESGEVRWILGGALADLAMDGEAFHMQHQFDRVDGGVLIFDNGTEERMASRAVEYALDLEAGTATEVWSHTADPPLYSYAMGDAVRLPGGSTVIAWGAAGRMDEVDADGEVLRTLEVELGSAVSYLRALPDLYP